jgi:hypothetical protein
VRQASNRCVSSASSVICSATRPHALGCLPGAVPLGGHQHVDGHAEVVGLTSAERATRFCRHGETCSVIAAGQIRPGCRYGRSDLGNGPTCGVEEGKDVIGWSIDPVATLMDEAMMPAALCRPPDYADFRPGIERWCWSRGVRGVRWSA